MCMDIVSFTFNFMKTKEPGVNKLFQTKIVQNSWHNQTFLACDYVLRIHRLAFNDCLLEHAFVCLVSLELCMKPFYGFIGVAESWSVSFVRDNVPA